MPPSRQNASDWRRFGGIVCLLASACGHPAGGGSAAEDDAGARAAHSTLTGRPEEDCAPCHPNHVSEWRISPHAYAMKDPVFQAMVRLGQQETTGELDQFCTGCHSPIGSRDGETDVVHDEAAGTYTQPTDGLSVEAMAGVSCEVCHSITAVDETYTSNARFDMTRDGVRRATISDPAPSSAHESAYSPLHFDSKICGVCHEVTNTFFDKDLDIERTLFEWNQSTFPPKGCQECHMEKYDGQAAMGGPDREVHRHTFVGVDVPLVPPDEFPGYDRMRELAADLLQDSAELTVEAAEDGRGLSVQIKNLAGHSLPTGATVDREMWLETIVTDADGKRVFESGTLDENGDLRVDYAGHTAEPGTDPQLVLYTQHLYFDPRLEDPASTEPKRRVDLLWEPNVQEPHMIEADLTDERHYDLSELPAGPYTATVRLLFRTFPPHLLRRLERDADLDPAVRGRVPTVEMERATIQLELP